MPTRTGVAATRASLTSTLAFPVPRWRTATSSAWHWTWWTPLPSLMYIPRDAFPWMEDMIRAYVAGCEAYHTQPRLHHWQETRRRLASPWYRTIHRLAEHVATAEAHGLFRAIYGLADALPRPTRRMGRNQRNKLRRVAGDPDREAGTGVPLADRPGGAIDGGRSLSTGRTRPTLRRRQIAMLGRIMHVWAVVGGRHMRLRRTRPTSRGPQIARLGRIPHGRADDGGPRTRPTRPLRSPRHHMRYTRRTRCLRSAQRS